MATCLDIITGAIVELGARQLNDPPSGEEADRGMVIFQAMFREAIDKGLFGRVSEVLATANYTAKENERVTANGYTITLPTSVIDSIEGVARPPRDLCQVQVIVAGSEPQISLWDAEGGAWVRIDSLTLAGTAPLSSRGRHAMECALGAKIAASLQRPVPPSCAAYGAGLASALATRLSAPRTYPTVDFF